MRRRPGFASTLAAVVVVTAPVAMVTIGAGTATAESRTVPMSFTQIFRRCDFSPTKYVAASGYARPTVVVHTGSNELVADVQIATAIPGIRYDVRMIQMPRVSSSPCGAGDPGVIAGWLNTDAAGAGSVTLRGPVAQGATGVWLSISRPGEFSQSPAEFYTTDFIAQL